MQAYSTPAGKEIEIQTDKKTGHLKVGFVLGGEVPFELSGLYTSDRDAEKDILIYLAKKITKHGKG